MEIIIVGAGIAGLSLALSLARRPGHRVLLLEAKPALAELGAGLQLTPPATRHLFAWGMRDDILAASIAPAEMLVRDGRSGAALAAIPTGGMEARYGAPYLVVHRAVLHDLLRRHAVAAGAELRLGSKLLGDANASARPTGLAAVRAMAEVAEIKADPQLASVVDLETYSSHLSSPPATTTINYDKLQKALGVFEHARKERVHIVQDASLHGGHVLHEEDPATREKVYAALRADGLQDEGVSGATLATESPTYGLADQRVRDWCFAYDPAKYIKECYESMA
ncbi:hypothetical protein MY1884_006492 [Beauveria asiatica]